MPILRVLGAMVLFLAGWFYLVTTPSRTLDLHCTRLLAPPVGISVTFLRKWANPFLASWQDGSFQSSTNGRYLTGYVQAIGSSMGETLLLHAIGSDGGSVVGRWDRGSNILHLYAGSLETTEINASCEAF